MIELARKEFPPPPETPVTLSKLYLAALSETDDSARSERLMDLGNTATRGSYDYMSIINTLSFSLDMAGSSNPRIRENARQLIAQINQYFLDQGMVIKSLYPKGQEGVAQQARTDRVQSRVRQYLRDIPKTFRSTEHSSVIRMLELFEPFMPQVYEGKNVVLTATPREPSLIEKSGTAAVRVLYGDIHDLTDEEIEARPNITAFTVPETILDLLKRAHERTSTTLVDLYTLKADGISIQDLEQETDQQKFNQNVIRYMANATDGNLLKLNVFKRLFLQPVGNRGLSPDFQFSNPEFSKKVFNFQLWCAERLLNPGVLNSQPDLEFDQNFNQLLSVKPEDLYPGLLEGMMYALTLRCGRLSEFDPEMTINQALADSPWQKALHERLPNFDFARSASGITIIEIEGEASKMLKEQVRSVASNLHSRFGATLAGRQYITQVVDRLEWISQRPGYVFDHSFSFDAKEQTEIDQNAPGIEMVSDFVLTKIAAQADIKPAAEAARNFPFDPEAHLRTRGIEDVEVYQSPVDPNEFTCGITLSKTFYLVKINTKTKTFTHIPDVKLVSEGIAGYLSQISLITLLQFLKESQFLTIDSAFETFMQSVDSGPVSDLTQLGGFSGQISLNSERKRPTIGEKITGLEAEELLDLFMGGTE